MANDAVNPFEMVSLFGATCRPKNGLRHHSMLALALLTALQCAVAAEVVVTSSPRKFAVTAPAGWTQQPTATGNSRVKFVSPAGTPRAECAVIVQEYPALRNQPQSYFDSIMLVPEDSRELAKQLSQSYSNVSVIGVGGGSLSGHPAQLSNVIYSIGTPSGSMWVRSSNTSAGTTPGLVWTVACGAMGKTQLDAEKGFSYWKLEIVKFPTSVKMLP